MLEGHWGAQPSVPHWSFCGVRLDGLRREGKSRGRELACLRRGGGEGTEGGKVWDLNGSEGGRGQGKGPQKSKAARSRVLRRWLGGSHGGFHLTSEVGNWWVAVSCKVSEARVQQPGDSLGGNASLRLSSGLITDY